MSTRTELPWLPVRLGDIGQSLIGLTYSPDNVKRSGTLVLRSSNIQDGGLSFDDNVYVDCTIPAKIRICENDILICVRNGSRRLIGKSVILDRRVVGQTFGAFMAVYRSDHNPYLQYFFQSHNFKRQIDEHLGATINQITNGSLNGFVVALPSEPEQRVITRCLKDVDDLISTLLRVMAKRQAVKHGVMQQLLTGRTRLSGFGGSWRVSTYRDLVNIERGQVLKASEAANGSVPVIAAGRSPSAFTDRSNRKAPVVTISASGASAGFVAYHSRPIFASDCSTISSNSCVDLSFIFYSLVLRQEQIFRAQSGGAQPHVHAKDIYPLKVDIPPTIEEQEAIASVLIGADTEIRVLERRLDKARSIRTGMIQELLSGRTRLQIPEGAV